MPKVSVIIPTYNRSSLVKDAICSVLDQTEPDLEVIVVDDASSDETSLIAAQKGAKVIKNSKNLGQPASLKKGFRFASGDIVVNLDADGEHNPEDIPHLVKPILDDEADLVLGKRKIIPRPSERLINRLARVKLNISDSGTGFRAIKRSLALKLKLNGRCICGILALEADRLDARIKELPIQINNLKKPRRIMWGHGIQFYYVLKELLKR